MQKSTKKPFTQLNPKNFTQDELFQDYEFKYLKCEIPYDYEQLSQYCNLDIVLQELLFKRTVAMIVHKSINSLNKADKRLPKYEKIITKTGLRVSQSDKIGLPSTFVSSDLIKGLESRVDCIASLKTHDKILQFAVQGCSCSDLVAGVVRQFKRDMIYNNITRGILVIGPQVQIEQGALLLCARYGISLLRLKNDPKEVLLVKVQNFKDSAQQFTIDKQYILEDNYRAMHYAIISQLCKPPEPQILLNPDGSIDRFSQSNMTGNLLVFQDDKIDIVSGQARILSVEKDKKTLVEASNAVIEFYNYYEKVQKVLYNTF